MIRLALRLPAVLAFAVTLVCLVPSKAPAQGPCASGMCGVGSAYQLEAPRAFAAPAYAYAAPQVQVEYRVPAPIVLERATTVYLEAPAYRETAYEPVARQAD